MSKKSKKQQPKRREPRFETSFSELMTGIGVKKARPAPQRGTATASAPMASRDRSELQQLLSASERLNAAGACVELVARSEVPSEAKALAGFPICLHSSSEAYALHEILTPSC